MLANVAWTWKEVQSQHKTGFLTSKSSVVQENNNGYLTQLSVAGLPLARSLLESLYA
jgi:hypothetical protein